ncbi:MAG: PilZ domain-containing protein [Thermoanaerobaculia bacterium]|nr:PilZ domain-containing protein [Thermoanaerobaculia bacterium]
MSAEQPASVEPAASVDHVEPLDGETLETVPLDAETLNAETLNAETLDAEEPGGEDDPADRTESAVEVEEEGAKDPVAVSAEAEVQTPPDGDGVEAESRDASASEERRTFERFPLQARAQVEFEERRYFLNENVLMASGNGMFLSSDQEAYEGERITFDLRLTSDGPIATGTGEVAWVQREADTPIAGGPGFGVRFLHVDARGAQLLIELSEAWAEGGKEALDTRLAAAVESWVAGDDTGPVRPIEDPESSLQETTELSTSVQDDIDTDPLMQVESLDTSSDAKGESWSPLEDTDEILPADGDPQGEKPSRGPTLEERDVLSKTLDVGGTRSVEALRQRSNQRTPVPIWPVLLTAGLLVGGLLWLTAPGPETSSDGDEVARAAAPDSDPASALVSLADPQDEGVPAATAATGFSEETTQVTPDGPEFRGIRDITWRRERGGILIVIELDGHLPAGGFQHSRPGSDPPREVVQFFDVADKYLVPELEVGGPEVDRIRVGHHLTDDGAEDRVVLDLTSKAVKLRSIEPQTDALHLFLQVEASEGANGPNP